MPPAGLQESSSRSPEILTASGSSSFLPDQLIFKSKPLSSKLRDDFKFQVSSYEMGILYHVSNVINQLCASTAPHSTSGDRGEKWSH